MENITKYQFAEYVRIQRGGSTNMLDTTAVSLLSGGDITRKEVGDIISGYDALAEKYPEVLRAFERSASEEDTLYLYKAEVSISCDVEVHAKSYEEARIQVIENVYVDSDPGIDSIDGFDLQINFIENQDDPDEEDN